MLKLPPYPIFQLTLCDPLRGATYQLFHATDWQHADALAKILAGPMTPGASLTVEQL